MAKKQILFPAMSKVGNLLWMGNILWHFSLPLAPIAVLPQKLLNVKLLLKDNFTLKVNIQVKLLRYWPGKGAGVIISISFASSYQDV